jgi:serine/threonine-protein kinase
VIPAALLVVVIGIAIGITRQQHQNSNGPQHREPAYGPQVTLPFTGLSNPGGVAVDTAGTVYIADCDNHRVLKLPAGSTTAVELPFTGLKCPMGVAVDTAGTVYITDLFTTRVLKLPAGSTTAVELPFTGLNGPEGVAVDTAGTVYIIDGDNHRALKLAAQ